MLYATGGDSGESPRKRITERNLWTDVVLTDMTNTILVPYDYSEHAEAALTYTQNVYPNATIVLLHAVEPFADHTAAGGYEDHRFEQMMESAEDNLASVAADAPHSDRIETEVAYGRPSGVILRTLQLGKANRVVMGSRGRTGAARILLGSVAETVVRRASEPVTVIRTDSPLDTPERVLVPFDGSNQSKNALRLAFEEFPEATVTALYVLYPTQDTRLSRREVYEPFAALEDWAERRTEHATNVLDNAADVAAEFDRELETVYFDGKPAEVLISYVEDEAIDHIVIGSTGRDGIGRLLLGSVAEKVVRRAPVSVTVTK